MTEENRRENMRAELVRAKDEETNRYLSLVYPRRGVMT